MTDLLATVQQSEGFADAVYIFIAGIFAVLVEGFRRYLFGQIENKLREQRREDDDERG
jgi:hypothetical protein